MCLVTLAGAEGVKRQGFRDQGKRGRKGGRTAVLASVTRRRAAVESGPELSRGGGSRGHSPNGGSSE